MIRYRLLLLLSATLLLLLRSSRGAHAERRQRRQQHPHPRNRRRGGHPGLCSFVDTLPNDAHRYRGAARLPAPSSSSSRSSSRPPLRRPNDDASILPRRSSLDLRRHGDASSSLSGVASSISSSSFSSSPIISPSDAWGNVAVLSFAASLAQLLGRTTTIGRLLGAPVTAMALSFALSSVDWIPRLSSSSWALTTLLPPGGSPASSFLQTTSLTLATPLLLLGTSIRGGALRRCGSLLASFVVASSGTLLGAIAAMSIPHVRHGLLSSLPNGDGAIIASALLAKNIGGGINYVAVCACLGASSESVAAGLCVDNVMALLYFPLVSLLASRYRDCDDDDDDDDVDHESGGGEDGADRDDGVGVEGEGDDPPSPMEALSHAMTLAAVLTALGQFLNSQLRRLTVLLGGATAESPRFNLSLPITTLLTVLFSTYYPPDLFLSPTTTTARPRDGNGDDDDSNNNIARAGQTLGTSLLYLFFATAGAPGWRLKDSIQKSFPSIASFLVVLYGVHGCVLLGTRWLITRSAATAATSMDGKHSAKDNNDNDDHDDGRRKHRFWKKVVAPQRLLVASSAAIGGPATAAALAKSFRWESLLTPSLLVGNFGYAVATFIGLLFYGVYR